MGKIAFNQTFSVFNGFTVDLQYQAARHFRDLLGRQVLRAWHVDRVSTITLDNAEPIVIEALHSGQWVLNLAPQAINRPADPVRALRACLSAQTIDAAIFSQDRLLALDRFTAPVPSAPGAAIGWVYHLAQDRTLSVYAYEQPGCLTLIRRGAFRR